MKIDERLPVSVMVEEEWRLQCTRFGEIGVPRRRIDNVPVGIGSTRLSQPKNVIGTLLAACQEDDSEKWSRASLALALPPCDERVLVGFVVEQFLANALLGIRVDGFRRLVDLEVGIELLAGECELKKAVGVECVRGHVDASFSIALKERNGASVAVSSEKRLHDDLGKGLRVMKS